MSNRFLDLLIRLIFIFAGFSQITYQNFKILDLVIMLCLVILFLNGYFRLNKMVFFFMFSLAYAFFIGKMTGYVSFFSDISKIILTVSLYVYFSKVKQSQIKKYLSLFNVSMFFSNLFALSMFIWVPSLREHVIDMSSYGYRLKGLFNQPNGYAFVLLVSIPISIYQFETGRNKLFNLLTIILGVFALILTQSRGAIFSLMLGAVAVYVFNAVYSTKKIPVKRFLIITASILFSFYAMYTTVPTYFEKNFSISLARINPLKEGVSERKISNITYEDIENDRLHLVISALKTLFVYPLGIGYQEQHEIIGKTTGIYLVPHNYFLKNLLTYGVFLGIVWNYLFIKLIFKGFNRLKRFSTQKKERFFYLHMVVVIVAFFYLTHSSDWIYFYIILTMYISVLFNLQPCVLNKASLAESVGDIRFGKNTKCMI